MIEHGEGTVKRPYPHHFLRQIQWPSISKLVGYCIFYAHVIKYFCSLNFSLDKEQVKGVK